MKNRTVEKIITQLLGAIYIDSQDPSVMRINFAMVLSVFDRHDIIVPPKILQELLTKVMEERLVGKIQSNETAKWIIAQAIFNVGLQVSVSKEDLLKIRLADNVKPQ